MKKQTITIVAFLFFCTRMALGQDQNVNGNLFVLRGSTLLGQTQIGDAYNHSGFFTNGPSYFGTSQLGQSFNVYGDATLNNNLRVNQGTTLLGQTQIGDANNHSGFLTNGPSFFGTTQSPQQVNVNGDVFLHNNLNIDGALGTTNVNGNMMLHHDVFVDGTTWLGLTNVGNASKPQQMNVYGPLYVGSSGNVQQTILNGPLYVGSSSNQQQTVLNGGLYVGTASAPGQLNVNGVTALHNDVIVDGTTHLGGESTINPGKYGQYALWVEKGAVSVDYAIAPTSDWADFVFNEGYKLPALKELEAYLKTNKHLPQIPAQAEVAKDGYSLRKINTVLLQKVEELTLYTIEQDKKMEALTAGVAEMKAVLEKLKK